MRLKNGQKQSKMYCKNNVQNNLSIKIIKNSKNHKLRSDLFILIKKNLTVNRKKMYSFQSLLKI